MAKKSKMFKGAAVSEAIYEEQAPMPDVPIDEEEPIFLEPEEVDIPVYVFAPKHSKSFKTLAAKQFSEGIVTKKGCILLPDGQIIAAGATIKTLMKPELKRLFISGALLAGKAPRKEKGARKARQ
jgi:hypothetical protein